MKSVTKLPIIGLAAFVLPLLSHAAPASWGSWTAVTDNSAIQTVGGYTTHLRRGFVDLCDPGDSSWHHAP